MPGNESLDASVSAGWKSVDEIVSHVKRAIPWIGDQVEQAMNRDWSEREAVRVGEILRAVVSDLENCSSELTELYVKTPDFQKILVRTLLHVAGERNEERLKLYRAFLSDTISSPCDPFDKQLQFLQMLKELRLDQMRLLKAIVASDTVAHQSASPIQILQKRLPDIHPDRIEGLVAQMNELGIIQTGNWKTANTSESLTALGQRLLRYMGRKV
jgi:hypothetical protein